MKNTRVILIILGIVIISTAATWVKYYSLQKKYAALLQKAYFGQSEGTRVLLEHRVINDAYIPTVFKFPDSIMIIDSTGNRKLLSSVLSGSINYFVFRFSPKLHCNSCVEEAMQNIKEIDPGKAKSVILLTTETTSRDLYVIANKYDIYGSVFSIDSKDLPQILEEKKEPYMFKLNKKLEADGVFLVEFDLAFLIPGYLRRISNNF